MLSRREKLLIRPWQLRRYNNHRKKVQSALPAIDFNTPPSRGHVTTKLKKNQQEIERKTKIEAENFRLLQKMGEIMKKNRLDNYWDHEPPNFLHKVGIYHRTRTPSPIQRIDSSGSSEIPLSRKGRCLACTPSQYKSQIIPEERIPWEPAKQRVSRKEGSLYSGQMSSDFDFSKTSGSGKYSISSIERQVRDFKRIQKTSMLSTSTRRSKSLSSASSKRLTIKDDGLELAVEFPLHAEVKLSEGKKTKVLHTNLCDCRSYRSQSISV